MSDTSHLFMYQKSCLPIFFSNHAHPSKLHSFTPSDYSTFLNQLSFPPRNTNILHLFLVICGSLPLISSLVFAHVLISLWASWRLQSCLHLIVSPLAPSTGSAWSKYSIVSLSLIGFVIAIRFELLKVASDPTWVGLCYPLWTRLWLLSLNTLYPAIPSTSQFLKHCSHDISRCFLCLNTQFLFFVWLTLTQPFVWI